MLDLASITHLYSKFDAIELCFAVGLLFLASVIRGLTGFGFSAILVTGLSFIIPPSQTVILALLLELVASLHLLPKAWNMIDWKLLGALGSGVLIGTPVGITLLAYTNPDIMRLIISCTVLTFGLLMLKGFSYGGPNNFPVHSGIGLISGVCNGTAALGGLPVVTFLLSTDTRVATTRASLIAAFFATDIYALIFAGRHGLLQQDVFCYGISALPILICGVAIGQRLFSIASPEFFKKVALLLLLVLSITGILRVTFAQLF